MSKILSMLEDYNDSYQESPQTANKFNLAKRDFELFKKETLNGDVYQAKLIDGNINAIIGKKTIFTVHLNLLSDEDRLFLSSKEGLLFTISSLKRNINTEEEFRCMLECRT